MSAGDGRITWPELDSRTGLGPSRGGDHQELSAFAGVRFFYNLSDPGMPGRIRRFGAEPPGPLPDLNFRQSWPWEDPIQSRAGLFQPRSASPRVSTPGDTAPSATELPPHEPKVAKERDHLEMHARVTLLCTSG